MTSNQNLAQMNAALDPSPILQTAFGFWQSKVLLTAVEFGVCVLADSLYGLPRHLYLFQALIDLLARPGQPE